MTFEEYQQETKGVHQFLKETFDDQMKSKIQQFELANKPQEPSSGQGKGDEIRNITHAIIELDHKIKNISNVSQFWEELRDTEQATVKDSFINIISIDNFNKEDTDAKISKIMEIKLVNNQSLVH